jgi:hypothetical protein
MPRYTLCPYYIDDNGESISCEDTIRTLGSKKKQWMDDYCDKAWESCPYAEAITKAYIEYERGDIKALDEEKITALTKENDSLRKKLGRRNKRIDRLEKKLTEFRQINKNYLTIHDTLRKQKTEYYKKWRETREELDTVERKVYDQIMGIVTIYEQRMAYLIDTYAPSGILEDNIKRWAADKEFAIVSEDAGEGKIRWVVRFKSDDEEEDAEDAERDTDLQTRSEAEE